MSQHNSGSATRRKRNHHEEHDEVHAHDESNWLVSYADMMTLLFGFFVLMYAFSRIDKDKFEVVSKEVAKYFGGQVKEDPALTKLNMEISNSLNKFGDAASVTTITGGIQLEFNGQILFDSGSARLKPDALPVLEQIVDKLKAQGGIREISVEGHTDDESVASHVFPTNWELSGARAARVVRQFEASGLPSPKLIAAGYGSSRPKVPNRKEDGTAIPENQQVNRRVLISILFDNRMDEAMKALASKDIKVKTPTDHLPDLNEMADDTTSGDDAANTEARMKQAKDRLIFARTQLNQMRTQQKEEDRKAAVKTKIQEMERQADQMLKDASELRAPKAPAVAPAPVAPVPTKIQ